MRLAADLTILFGGIMLWGHLSMTYARPVSQFNAQAPGAQYRSVGRVAKAPAPGRAAPPGNDAERRADELPNPPPGRRNGHMSPEDRRLLRQHIQDAVRELYSH